LMLYNEKGKEIKEFPWTNLAQLGSDVHLWPRPEYRPIYITPIPTRQYSPRPQRRPTSLDLLPCHHTSPPSLPQCRSPTNSMPHTEDLWWPRHDCRAPSPMPTPSSVESRWRTREGE
jgi:hypothetical protein